MRKAAGILLIFFLGVLVGSVFIVPGTGDVDWVMGDIETVGARVGVYPGPDGTSVADVLGRIVDRLLKCCPQVAPDAVDDVVRTTPGNGIFIDVLANDTDLDRDALSIVGLQQPVVGSAVVDMNRIHYLPPSNMTGWDSFHYDIDDGQGGTSQAAVMVAIESGPILSEIEMDPAGDDDGAEWVELFNGSTEEVSLAGWGLSITADCPTGEGSCWEKFPDGAVIAPWGHYVLVLPGTKLANTTGWRIQLHDAEWRIVDQTVSGLQDTLNNYMTWQRLPNGSLDDSAWTLSPSTREAENK